MFDTKVMLLFLLAFASGTTMGISQKFLAGYSPFLVYGVAGLVQWLWALLLWYVWHGQQSGQLHWAMVVLGLALLGLNIAFSMLYAQQIPIAYVPIIVTGVMAVTLSIVGYFFFHEAFSWKFVIGAVMILGGMVVMIK